MLGGLGLILITGGIFFVWYLLFSLWGLEGERTSYRLISAGVMTTAQIILSEILLGHFGFLTLSRVIFVTTFISTTLFCIMVYKRREAVTSFFMRPSKGLFRTILDRWGLVQGWENWVMLFLIGLLFLWLGTAAILLPPRSFDDVYHLPQVFQFLKDHRIFLLPIEILSQFAYPLNAELLLLWPLLFLHDARVVVLPQGFAALWGVLVLYNLSVNLGVKPRLALFVSLLFPLIPVISGQAASSNIDLIAGVFLLINISFAVKFWRNGQPVHYYLAGITGGLLIGMKYSMVLFVIGLQPLLLYPLWKGMGKKLIFYGAVYLGLIFVFGGYWYLRNYWIFGKPFWPFPL